MSRAITGGTLNTRQRLFVSEYLVDLHASKAAIRAGYSEKTASQIGNALLRKAPIQELILSGYNSMLDRVRTEAIATRTEVLEKDTNIARANLFDFIAKLSSHGVQWHNLNDIPRPLQELIQELTVDPDKGTVKIKLFAKHPSLDRLLKHHEHVTPEPDPAARAIPEAALSDTVPLGERVRHFCRELELDLEMTVGEVCQRFDEEQL